MILFSIIVPVYKVEKYLDECVSSVINQTYNNWELILVDDGSPDKCPEKCNLFAKTDNRIKVIHKSNGGPSAARNTGVKIATGEYILFLDGDDFFDTDYLRQLNITIEKKRKDLYLGNSRYDYSNGKSVKYTLFDIKDVQDKDYYDVLEFLFTNKGGFPGATCHNVFSRSFIQNNNIQYDENLTWSEDLDYFFKCVFSTKEIGFNDYPFYYYRKDNQGAATKRITKKNILSNLSVSKEWFNIVLNTKDLECIKTVLLSMLANMQLSIIKYLSLLPECDVKEVCSYFESNKEMFNYCNGIKYKILLLLKRIFGSYTTSRILVKLDIIKHSITT